MSIYTTLTVSRQAAIKKIDELRNNKGPSNEELESILEGYFMDKTLYNFTVVDDNECLDDGTLEYL